MRWVVIARRIFAGLLVLVVLALVGGYWYARPLLLTGTGYAAHNACALGALAGRANAETDLPPNPLVPYLRTTATGDGSAQSSVFGLLATQKAWATPNGCILSDDAPAESTFPLPIDTNPNPYATAPTPTPDPALEALLDTAFGADLTEADRQALGTRAIVVLKDGEIVAERYAPGFEPTTRQLGWSMTKSVTNLLVGLAVQTRGTDITATQLWPGWTGDRAQITMDELMRMTSGLQWDETYDLGTPITTMLYLEPDMPAFVANQPSVAIPGEVQLYSSGSTTLLCSILSSQSGIQPSTLGSELMFRPLGLKSAVLETDAKGNPVCSSYLWATPRDWAAIGQFALQDGQWDGQQLLPATWMAESLALKPVTSSDEEAYAAGWRVNTRLDGSPVEPRLPADAYWAQGHDGQRMYIVPSEDLVVVRLGFSPGLAGDDLRVVPLVAGVGSTD